jgi:hypothetical protein
VAFIAAAGVDVVADLMATHGRELWAVAAAAGGACGGWGRSLARYITNGESKGFSNLAKKLPRAEKSARRLNWFLEFLFYFI